MRCNAASRASSVVLRAILGFPIAAIVHVVPCANADVAPVRPDLAIRASDPQPYDAFGYGFA